MYIPLPASHEQPRLNSLRVEPTLVMQGGSDYCNDPKESEGIVRFFTGVWAARARKCQPPSLIGKADPRRRNGHSSDPGPGMIDERLLWIVPEVSMPESKTLTLLITGATGNVGSELTKQLSAQKVPFRPDS